MDIQKLFKKLAAAYSAGDTGVVAGNLTTFVCQDEGGWSYTDQFLSSVTNKDLSFAGREVLVDPDGNVRVTRCYCGGVPGGNATLASGGLTPEVVFENLRVFIAQPEGWMRTPRYSREGEWEVAVDGFQREFRETLWYKDVPVHRVSYTVEVYDVE
jgi:hypothetical protein